MRRSAAAAQRATLRARAPASHVELSLSPVHASSCEDSDTAILVVTAPPAQHIMHEGKVPRYSQFQQRRLACMTSSSDMVSVAVASKPVDTLVHHHMPL